MVKSKRRRWLLRLSTVVYELLGHGGPGHYGQPILVTPGMSVLTLLMVHVHKWR